MSTFWVIAVNSVLTLIALAAWPFDLFTHWKKFWQAITLVNNISKGGQPIITRNSWKRRDRQRQQQRRRRQTDPVGHLLCSHWTNGPWLQKNCAHIITVTHAIITMAKYLAISLDKAGWHLVEIGWIWTLQVPIALTIWNTPSLKCCRIRTSG